MASVNPEQHAPYQQEAGEFLTVMDEMAPQIGLDYSVDSLQRLDQFISEHFDPPNTKVVSEALTLRVGCYLGEVIIRHLGGEWNEDGKPEINHLGPVEAIYPIERAKQRFENGKQESLSWYYHAIAKKLYEAGGTLPQYAGLAGGVDATGYGGPEEGGVIAFFMNLFRKS
jgi:hypothetical protein